MQVLLLKNFTTICGLLVEKVDNSAKTRHYKHTCKSDVKNDIEEKLVKLCLSRVDDFNTENWTIDSWLKILHNNIS